MTRKRGWFERPFAALCILSGVTVLSVYIILNAEGRREGGGEIGYGINLRHYGMDARKMESTVAIPLEDALSAISGISRIVTASENGRVRAYVNFRQNRGIFRVVENDYYDAVRETAQRVYETLPPSAQRPEISSAGDFRIPFWTSAVYDSADTEAMPTGTLLERVIKPALSGIEGVGEVEVSGPGIGEILITLDQEKSAAIGLNPASVSGVLAANDALFLGGLLRYNDLDIPVRVDGRYAELRDIGEALLPLDSGGAVPLKSVADIREQEREGETLSRLNGKRTAVISVTAAFGADPGILSRKIKKEIEKFSSLPLEFRLLEDRGAEEAAAFRSILFAALESSVLVALAAFLLRRGEKSSLYSGLICAAAILLISVMSAAVLSAAGFPINRKFLTGLAVGIGGAADAVILSAEGFGRAGNPGEGKMILRSVWPLLISGAATTVAALLPLLGIGAGDIAVIAGAVGTVTLVSVFLALALLPPLFLWKKTSESRKPRLFSFVETAAAQALPKKIRRCLSRLFTVLIRLCVKRSFVFPAISFLIAAAAVLILVFIGTDTSGEWAEDSVYVHIEFEGGFLKEEGDQLLARWAVDLKKHPAVRDVQTGARTGSGYGLVTFDPRGAETAEVRELIRSKTIPGASVYIPEPSQDDRIWTISISGDDADKCRELANNGASLCSALGPVKETVLNFKRGEPRLTLIPRRELLTQKKIPFSLPADIVRRGVHGPVAYKRTGGNSETDVRVRFGSSKTSHGALDGNDVLHIPFAAPGDNSDVLYIASLTEAVRDREVSSIQRKNRRRVASFSIRTGPGDPRYFRDETMKILKNLELPPGYRVEFDPEAVGQAEALSGKFFNFIWAVLFCYMIIAAAEESFVLPLIILSSVPPSLAVPVLILGLSGTAVNTAAACALVAVSGMTVNASVISAGELWRRRTGGTESVYRILRSRLPVLIATTGTTIAGALPFLFLREGSNALVRTLALVTVTGVGASLFCSLTLVPSLMNFYWTWKDLGHSTTGRRNEISPELDKSAKAVRGGSP